MSATKAVETCVCVCVYVCVCVCVCAVRKLLTGDLKAPFASYPPFPGDTEAQYLRYSVY